MYRATRSFDFDGEHYVTGVSQVSHDHPALAAHPENFAQATSGSARILRITPKRGTSREAEARRVVISPTRRVRPAS
jgi:hypothetical protein